MTPTSMLLLLVLAAAASEPLDPPRLDKMGRILALEDQRSTGGAELAQLLADPDRSVRRRAALAAGRIGDASLAPNLQERLNDAEAEVRQMSAFALGLLKDKGSVDRLLAALQDPEPVVRARVVEALGRIGDARAAAALADYVLATAPPNAALVTVRGDDAGNPRDPWFELRAGLYALAALKDARAAEKVLLNAGRPRFDWWAATWTAMRLETPALRPLLDAAARSSDPFSRALAARGLGALKDHTVVETLGRLAADPDRGVTIAALRALGATGDGQATALVGAALGSRDPVVLWEALKALAQLPADKGLKARVVPLVGHEAAWIRAAALPVLARLDAEEFVLILSGLDPDADWTVRAATATALGQAGGSTAVEVLFSMLKDEDPRVLPAVLDALRLLRGKDAIDTLRRHLEHPDVIVRAAAADGLAELGATSLVEPLLAAWRASLADPDLDLRVAVVAALGKDSGAGATSALTEIARQDPSRVVRERAAAALLARGAPAPATGPERVSPPPLDYRQLMLPVAPVPGEPLYTPRAIVHTRRGEIEIHLNIVEAPLAAASFLDLAARGYFNGLTFHRVVPEFVVQGGDPRGDGSGGPGYTVRDEVGQRPFGRGVVGIALAGRDTGGSQFFITLNPAPHLDSAFPVLGWVARGMEVADALRPGDVIERVEIWDGR